MNKRLQYASAGYLLEKGLPNDEGLNNTVVIINRIRNLAKQHHRQCENACNGEGYIPRRGFFTCGQPSQFTKDAYLVPGEEENTYFLAVKVKPITKIERGKAK